MANDKCPCCGQLADGYMGDMPVRETCYVSGDLYNWLKENGRDELIIQVTIESAKEG